jgi:uncharacterized protein
MRIAIVGGGVSGMVVAHLLHATHDVVLFEAGDRAGGHANTVRVDTPNQTHHVDTGFVVFNDRNYPCFERLLERLGIGSQGSTMSFSVSDGAGDFEYSSASALGLFAKPGHLISPRFHRMLADLVRFNRAARRLLLAEREDPTLGEWLERQRFSQAFIERLIVPQVSAVWSADPNQRWSFPARFLVRFFANHGMLSFVGRPRWRTIPGGSTRYVRALVAPLGERVRLRTAVHAVERRHDHVLVRARGREDERFDQVVLATHSDQALALLSDASDSEREILGSIPYQRNEAALHTDVRMLPRRRRAWASWNYHLPEPGAASAASSKGVAITYHMNRLQSLRAERELCVTLNRSNEIDPSKLIRTISYAHPLYTAAGVRAQQRHEEISARNRTHYCGAYWGWGFHEDGVRSALRVAERFGARL